MSCACQCREILNHQELSQSKHPHIVEFKEVFVTPRYLAEVLEYVEGETLQVFLEKVREAVVCTPTRAMAV